MWLVPHPDFPPPADVKVRVDASRRPGGYLGLSFTVSAAPDVLVWDGEGLSGRTNELWRHGCLEAFVAGGGAGYIELNLSPKARWAAYAFDGYRKGMRDAAVELTAMHWLARDLSIPRYEMHALVRLPAELEEAHWTLNLTAVIEAKDGSKSYWALAHGDGPPDFHSRACFVATLPA